MKKPFKKTKAFQLIKFASPVLKSIPWVGGVIQNVVDDNSTEPGVIDGKEFNYQVIQLVVAALLVIAYLKGWITFEQAEQAKEFITN